YVLYVYLLFHTALPCSFLYFFFNDTTTTEIYTLSLHDALPIYKIKQRVDEYAAAGATRVVLNPIRAPEGIVPGMEWNAHPDLERDRKSTRLNSSHLVISYAVFCLKKKKKK